MSLSVFFRIRDRQALVRIPLFWLALGTVMLFIFSYGIITDGLQLSSYWMISQGILLFLFSFFVGFITIRWFWRFLKAILT